MPLSPYEMDLAVKSIVLVELRDAGAIPGDELRARVRSRCEIAKRRIPDFGFLGWAGTTIWGVLETFVEAGFVTHTGPLPSIAMEWCTSTLRIESRGREFLAAVEREAPSVLSLIEAEVATRAAAG